MIEGQGEAGTGKIMSQPQGRRDTQWIRDAFDRYEGPLVRYAMRLTGDLDTARDVVQDTFLRLCRQQRSQVEPHLAAWLFTVCRRRGLDVACKLSRMRPLSGECDEPSSLAKNQQELAELHEAAGQILALLETLPKRQQEVIRLKFQNGLSYREIGKVMGLSVSNVGYLIHTAVRKVRQLATYPAETTDSD
jgi:RNA polymerase sigma-70 factor (ECF subfamily)